MKHLSSPSTNRRKLDCRVSLPFHQLRVSGVVDRRTSAGAGHSKGVSALGHADATVTVRADEVVAELGLKLPLAPVGKPLMERFTGELNPPDRVIVTV